MANNTLQQIATNLGVTGYDDSSLLIGIAEYYGVNPNHSKCLMFDILDAQGGDAANSKNYMEDLVVTLSGTANSLNVIEAWETITAIPPAPPAPVNTVAPVISGTMVVGQTLTTTNGTWTNSPTSFTYQWYNGLAIIVGATSSTYILVQADAGTTTAIKCEVTAINLGGSTAADSNTLTTVYDADAQAFITAAVITVLAQKTAINELTIGLKADSLWTSMKAIYPIVGGTATTHKYNLKDPRDLDVAFRLAFNGGITHSTTGALPNGTNGYANTFFVPSVQIANADSFHFSVYSRTNTPPAVPSFDIGTNIITGTDGDTFADAETHSFYYMKFFGFTTARHGQYASTSTFVDADSLGLYVANRNLANNVKSYKNGVLKNTGAPSPTGLAYSPMYLLGLNEYYPDLATSNTYYGKRQLAFATIGTGLTNTDSANLYTRIQAFQTTLSRQV